ncbi:MAG: DUF58 domain-containing protein [Flavobacteriales bacterium]
MPINIDRKRIQNVSRLEMLARQAVEGFITGMHKSPFHGFSVEFAEHRQYNSGESTRHLDWKLLARTDKHFVKRYEEETNLRCQILIDTSASMFFPNGVKPEGEEMNKLKFSIYASAALIELLKHQRDAVGLSLFGDKIDLNTRAGSSGAHINFLFAELESLLNKVDGESGKKSFVTDTIHEIAESVHRRSMIIIFSDMMDNSENAAELFSALQHLKHNKHEVVLFHVIDKSKEVQFNYENRPYTFVDLESGDEIKVNPADVRDIYVRNYEKFKTDLKLKCGSYAIDFVEADINEGFDHILLQYLIKRQKMRV